MRGNLVDDGVANTFVSAAPTNGLYDVELLQSAAGHTRISMPAVPAPETQFRAFKQVVGFASEVATRSTEAIVECG
jgi:hypothetical protein